MDPKDSEILKEESCFPVQLPLFDVPPRQSVIQYWVLSHRKIWKREPLVAQIARKIAENINYIGFEKFLAQLKITIEAFNKQCNEPYVLCISEVRAFKLDEGTSHIWMAGLAFELCGLSFPHDIIFSYDLCDYLKQNPETRNVLVLDDAAYSGSQLFGLLKGDIIATNDNENVTLHFGLPYITEQAKERLNIFTRWVNVNFLPHTILPTVKDILSYEELEAANKYVHGLLSRLSLHCTLSYFSHKLPDCMSTLPVLTTGEMLSFEYDIVQELYRIEPDRGMPTAEGYRPVGRDEWNAKYDELVQYLPIQRLVPMVIPPYKLHDQKHLWELAMAVKRGLCGVRTSYPALTLPEGEEFRSLRNTLAFRSTEAGINDLHLSSPETNQQNIFFGLLLSDHRDAALNTLCNVWQRLIKQDPVMADEVFRCLKSIFQDSSYSDECTMKRRVKAALTDPGSRLYRALNSHRNYVPLTFFGARHLISTKTRDLQEIEKAFDLISEDEKKYEGAIAASSS